MRLVRAYIDFIDARIVARNAGFVLFALPLKGLLIAVILLRWAGLRQEIFDVIAWPIMLIVAVHLLTFVFRRAVFIPEDHPDYIKKQQLADQSLVNRVHVLASLLNKEAR